MRSPGWRRRAGLRPYGFCREFRRSFSMGRKLSASVSTIELDFEVMAWNGGSEAVTKGHVALGQEVISVCDPQQPVSVGAALVTLERALDALNAADVASVPASVQAQALRVLERA